MEKQKMELSDVYLNPLDFCHTVVVDGIEDLDYEIAKYKANNMGLSLKMYIKYCISMMNDAIEV